MKSLTIFALIMLASLCVAKKLRVKSMAKGKEPWYVNTPITLKSAHNEYLKEIDGGFEFGDVLRFSGSKDSERASWILIPAGDGKYHLQNRGTHHYLTGDSGYTMYQSGTPWTLIDTGNNRIGLKSDKKGYLKAEKVLFVTFVSFASKMSGWETWTVERF